MHNLEKLSPFKYYVMTSFPYIEADFDALTNYELFCKVTQYLNDVVTSQNNVIDNFNEIYAAWMTTKAYIDDYFENLDVQEEINTKLDSMAADGSLSDLIDPELPALVSAWLTSHITPTTPAVDNTLSVSGAAADAKVTGDTKFGYRGLMSTLQYTAFSSCTASGFYRFATSDIANITDVPTDVISGGLLFNYPYSLSTSYQILLSGEGQWFRYYSTSTIGSWKRLPITDTTLSVSGAAADAKATGDSAFLYRGGFTDLSYTSTRDCKKIGFYRFTTAEIASIADMPSGVTVGGMIAVFPNTSTSRFQLLISQNKQYFRYDADSAYAAWAQMPITDTTLSVSGMAADAGKVGTHAMLDHGNIANTYGADDCNECEDPGCYQWFTDQINSIANLPPNVTAGGELVTYVNHNYEDDIVWQLAFNSNAIWIRYGLTGTWQTLYNKYNIRKPYVRWRDITSGNDSGVEDITVYFYKQDAGQNTQTDRITYLFVRSQSVANDCDVYRLGYIYKNINGTNTRLTRQAEFECAMSAGGAGYIGGYLHGHEKNGSCRIWVDGVEMSKANLTNGVNFNTLKMIMKSDIYYDGSILCEHVKEYNTDAGGVMNFRQSLNFKASATINNCYLCMLPPLKTLVSEYNYNSSLAIKSFIDLGTDYTEEMPNATECEIFGDNLYMTAGHGYYWPDNDISGRQPFISDHDSEYHKFYFTAADDTVVASGDSWKSDSYIYVK